ncbi:MAG: hypothetical protein LW809_07430 [Vampirovibrionales bacterium]|nr:hypothetical protein [Vampirovibrionales bacterium]
MDEIQTNHSSVPKDKSKKGVQLKIKALKFHKLIGSLLLLPLAWTATTGMAFTIVKEILGNKVLGKSILHLHTLQTFGLHKIYPLILGVSVLVALGAAVVLMWKSPKKK